MRRKPSSSRTGSRARWDDADIIGAPKIRIAPRRVRNPETQARRRSACMARSQPGLGPAALPASAGVRPGSLRPRSRGRGTPGMEQRDRRVRPVRSGRGLHAASGRRRSRGLGLLAGGVPSAAAPQTRPRDTGTVAAVEAGYRGRGTQAAYAQAPLAGHQQRGRGSAGRIGWPRRPAGRGNRHTTGDAIPRHLQDHALNAAGRRDRPQCRARPPGRRIPGKHIPGRR